MRISNIRDTEENCHKCHISVDLKGQSVLRPGSGGKGFKLDGKMGKMITNVE